mgnify:CR=1 FL=1
MENGDRELWLPIEIQKAINFLLHIGKLRPNKTRERFKGANVRHDLAHSRLQRLGGLGKGAVTEVFLTERAHADTAAFGK